ncbi:MAG: DUF4249 domain-containing protein [Bacteroidota bacterium]
MMKNAALYFLLLLCCIACEEEITPVMFDDPADLVVEGFIEGGEVPTPPVVILTRSIPFTQSSDPNLLSDIFVHNASVFVDDGTTQVQLTEFCWDDLEEEQKKVILENFNLGFDSLAVNICAYTDAELIMQGEVGKRYELRIEVDGKVLTSSTAIPKHIPIDTLYFKNVEDPFWELIGFIQDDPDEASFYRYFTSVNQGLFLSPFTSVSDDLFFNGQSFEFPLNKAERGTTPIQEYGLYNAGDTVGIKWTNIDEAHFRFWNTLEFNSFNQGPFSSYTRIEGNIEGGLGVWGGYSNSYYFLIVPE